jgi:hypothetical protein
MLSHGPGDNPAMSSAPVAAVSNAQDGEMRGLFSMVGLLVVLAIVGLIAKHQLGASGMHKAATASSSPVSDVLDGKAPQIDTPAQAQQLQKQVQGEVNQLMQNRASDIEQQTEPKP